MEIVNFTPLSAALGGALIGLSAAFLLLVKGRVAGISGIFGGIVYPEKGDVSWRILFIAGLIIGGFIYQWLGAGAGVDHIEAVVGTPWLIAAGLLVGVGTTIGTGCTSGHGICGIGRLSKRSIVATLVFMASGIIAVCLTNQINLSFAG